MSAISFNFIDEFIKSESPNFSAIEKDIIKDKTTKIEQQNLLSWLQDEESNAIERINNYKLKCFWLWRMLTSRQATQLKERIKEVTHTAIKENFKGLTVKLSNLDFYTPVNNLITMKTKGEPQYGGFIFESALIALYELVDGFVSTLAFEIYLCSHLHMLLNLHIAIPLAILFGLISLSVSCVFDIDGVANTYNILWLTESHSLKRYNEQQIELINQYSQFRHHLTIIQKEINNNANTTVLEKLIAQEKATQLMINELIIIQKNVMTNRMQYQKAYDDTKSKRKKISWMIISGAYYGIVATLSMIALFTTLPILGFTNPVIPVFLIVGFAIWIFIQVRRFKHLEGKSMKEAVDLLHGGSSVNTDECKAELERMDQEIKRIKLQNENNITTTELYQTKNESINNLEETVKAQRVTIQEKSDEINHLNETIKNEKNKYENLLMIDKNRYLPYKNPPGTRHTQSFFNPAANDTDAKGKSPNNSSYGDIILVV
jgi:hypothetical protein